MKAPWHSLQLLLIAIKDLLRQHPAGLRPVAIHGSLARPPEAELLQQILDIMVQFGEILKSSNGIYLLADLTQPQDNMQEAPRRQQFGRGDLKRKFEAALADGPADYIQISEALEISDKRAASLVNHYLAAGLIEVIENRGRRRVVALAAREEA